MRPNFQRLYDHVLVERQLRLLARPESWELLQTLQVELLDQQADKIQREVPELYAVVRDLVLSPKVTDSIDLEDFHQQQKQREMAIVPRACVLLLAKELEDTRLMSATPPQEMQVTQQAIPTPQVR